MPWWGGGDDSASSSSSSGTTDFTSADDAALSHGSGGNMMSSGGGGGGGSTGLQEMQQMSLILQQQMIVQQVINDLSDRAYTQCITSKPSSGTLSGSQVACIRSTVNKWLDANELITGRLAKKQQASSQQAGFSGFAI